MNLQTVKNRFGIIGNSEPLNRALDVAIQVAPTDITVLITGESGTGKENMPKIKQNWISDHLFAHVTEDIHVFVHHSHTNE